MRRNLTPSIWIAIFAGIACALLVVGMLPGPAQAAEISALPPRPTLTPTPTPTPIPVIPVVQPPTGGLIILQVEFGEAWPATGLAWQDLWTVVEWQDPWGEWHVVEGWQGTLDEVVDGVGWKSWWMDEPLFGKGPFRWMIYESEGGEEMFTTETFDLPNSFQRIVIVRASLAQ